MPDLRSKTRWRVLPREGCDPDGGIHYPADDEVLTDLIAGRAVSDAVRAASMVPAMPGDIVEDLPAVSVDGLLARRQIVEAETKEDPFWTAPDDNSGDTDPAVDSAPAPIAGPEDYLRLELIRAGVPPKARAAIETELDEQFHAAMLASMTDEEIQEFEGVGAKTVDKIREAIVATANASRSGNNFGSVN